MFRIHLDGFDHPRRFVVLLLLGRVFLGLVVHALTHTVTPVTLLALPALLAAAEVLIVKVVAAVPAPVAPAVVAAAPRACWSASTIRHLLELCHEEAVHVVHMRVEATRLVDGWVEVTPPVGYEPGTSEVKPRGHQLHVSLFQDVVQHSRVGGSALQTRQRKQRLKP